MSIKVLPYQLKKQVEEIKKEYYYPSFKSLRGNILEIGFGKGDNFKYYPDECKVFAIEKKEKLLTFKNEVTRKVNFKKGTAEHLPFENNFFDAVVFSFVLCSVNSVENTIKEINRVLKKDSKILLLEHIKSNNKVTYTFQKVLTGLQTLFTDCHLDRDPRRIIKENNFRVIEEKKFNNSLEPYLFMKLIKQ